jgi:putative endonuclease
VSKENINFGKSGEEAAVSFLRKNGYRIIAKNYRTRLGEIDIIASEKGEICFVEVKTRNSDAFGLPAEAITGPKRRQISKCALLYLKENNLMEKEARFDVVSVMFSGGKQEIEIIKDAFELEGEYAV